LGSVWIPLSEIFTALFDIASPGTAHQTIVLKSRLPAALTAILAGIGLSISGLFMQTFFRNPVAGPFILGISSGAALGVALLVLGGSIFGFSMWSNALLYRGGVVLFAATGALLIFLGIYFLSLRLKNKVVLLIVGLMISGLIGSIVQILQGFAEMRSLQMFVIWTFGGFKSVTSGQLLPFAIVVLLGLGILFSQVKPSNLLLLGEEQAAGMGANLKRIKKMVIIGACILASAVTAFCGPIAFIGLAVPHFARATFGTEDHRILFPACLFIGASTALVCNVISTLPGLDQALPLNAVTALFGAPVVVWVVLRNQDSTKGFS
jgi:iron complex transport system permease protein